MGAKNSRSKSHIAEFGEDDLEDQLALENADVNLTNNDTEWIKANVSVENGKVIIYHSRSTLLKNKVSEEEQWDAVNREFKKLKSVRSRQRVLLDKLPSMNFYDNKSQIAEIKLVEKPELKVEEQKESWELIVKGNLKMVRIRAADEDEATKWMKLMRHEIMRSLNANGLFFTSDLYDPNDDYRIKMFEAEYKEEIKEAEDLGIEDVDEIDEKEPNILSTTQQFLLTDRQKFNETHKSIKPPNMNICILVVGTRGDVQPFVYLGQQLQKDGHRVRLATHAEYRNDVIEKGGLEYYPLGGDPRKLSEYMVKTGGRLMPDLLSREELASIPEKLQMLKEITYSTWPACTEPDPEDTEQKPFVAEAIISNPVSYGHIHCAQALSVPLHIMFPQPWSPTKCFPHPLSNLSLDSDWSIKNYYSFLMVDEFMWLGWGGMMNQFRKQVLKLHMLRFGEHGENLLNHWKVPISHMWSPSFVPKCKDWHVHVDVVGEFRSTDPNTQNSYQPSVKLSNFLLGGPKPLYIGFGSMVIEDSSKLVDIIKKAANLTKCRILLQSGWTKYAEDYDMLSPEVVSGVIHHGGAGTTSAGLRAGNPTFICPFFGDQHFWAEMVYRSGAGPRGCPVKSLTLEKMLDAMRIMRDPQTLIKTEELSLKMQAENGTQAGVDSFYRNLPLHKMVCDVSIFDNQKSRVASVFCFQCGLKMCDYVDKIIHSETSDKKDHIRIPFKSKLWGRSIKNEMNSRKQIIANMKVPITNRRSFIKYKNSSENTYENVFKSSVEHQSEIEQNQIGINDATPSKKASNPSPHRSAKNSTAGPSSPAAVTAVTETNKKDRNKSFVGVPRIILKGTDPNVKSSALSSSSGNTLILSETEMVEQAYMKACEFLSFWEKVDADGNGELDEKELEAFFKNKDDAKAVLDLVDSDGDHVLTFSELAWFISQKATS